jgi:hypothetical protein
MLTGMPTALQIIEALGLEYDSESRVTNILQRVNDYLEMELEMAGAGTPYPKAVNEVVLRLMSRWYQAEEVSGGGFVQRNESIGDRSQSGTLRTSAVLTGWDWLRLDFQMKRLLGISRGNRIVHRYVEEW